MKKISIGLKILISICFIIFLSALYVFYGYREATQLPENRPETFQRSRKDSKVVVTIGDSITHAGVSSDYVEILEQRDSSDEYNFINAGINSELTYHVLQRINDIVACNPDFITILIGTNDVLALIREKSMEENTKNKNLPRTPDAEWFEENLTLIIKILQKETKANIALISLPPVTERKNYLGYETAASYSEIIRSIAAVKGVFYIPFFEKLDNILSSSETSHGIDFDPNDSALTYKTAAMHYLFKKSWNRISEKNGLILLTDNIHLNDRSALILSDMIEEFLTQ